MKTKFVEERIAYDGSQLRSLYSYLEHGMLGDSIVAWVGECNVSLDHMVDGEDKVSNSEIRGSEMLHFILEKFPANLSYGVAAQRLFAAIVKDTLLEKVDLNADDFKRDGDDIYWQGKKFSISIATVCPVSTLIHFAVNVRNEGAPVETCALEDFGLDPKQFASDVLEKASKELQEIDTATQKVHWAQ